MAVSSPIYEVILWPLLKTHLLLQMTSRDLENIHTIENNPRDTL